MPKFSPFSKWLARKEPLHHYSKGARSVPNFEFGSFLALDKVIPVHKSFNLRPQSLAYSWRECNEFMESALEIVNMTDPGWLDREEVEMIEQNLGEPPQCCYPLYLISVKTGLEERVVYIGKNSSRTSRFKGGHTAITRLHDPKYSMLSKNIYLATFVFMDKDHNLIPLEWISDFKLAEEYLSSVEAQLIYELKPELNKTHMKNYNTKYPVQIHIQNFTGSKLLNDVFIDPR